MRRNIFSAGAAAAAVAAVVVGAQGVARAQGALGGAQFGRAGQLAIQADLELRFQGFSGSNNGGTGSDIVVQPAADYFVIDNLSVGGMITFENLTFDNGGGGSTTTTTFGFAPRVGYDIAIVDKLSFWPDLFVEYSTASTSNNGGSENIFSLGVFAPLLFHPVPHFFVGLGPDLSTELSHDRSNNGQTRGVSKLTQYGVMSTIGGWFSLGGG
jgi:hypothetical protein